MHNNLFIFLLLITPLAFLSCDNTPRKSELRSRLKGTYCNDTHTLILTDSTYQNTRLLRGTLEGTPFTESCKGTYSIELHEGRWVLKFHKDPQPQSSLNCQQEFTIWSEKEGFLLGESEIVLRDLFDNTEVRKGGCK